MSVHRFRKILESDSRFSLGAYRFVLQALNYTQRQITEGAERHISGQELLEGIQEFALEEFGPLGGAVFRIWGIQSTEDIGEVVFNLVEHDFMGKRKEDSIDDFSNGFEIDTYFWEAYKEQTFEE